MRLLPEQRQSMVGAVRRGFKKILTDNGPQFREKWKRWCNENHVEPLFAHPYYPMIRGKWKER